MERIPVIVAVAIVTYLTRIAGFRIGSQTAPPSLNRFLAYVPVASFAALAAPDIAGGPGTLPARIIGAGLAALVVLRVGPLWTGLLAGMAAFWTTGFLLG